MPETPDRSTATGRAVLDWPRDPVADALALRVLGALHALHRAPQEPVLEGGFAGELAPARLAATLRQVIRAHDAALLPWLAGPPQTNEVARSAALMAGLLHLAARRGPQVQLLAIGSSAGLNPATSRHRHGLGGIRIGPADAALRLAPSGEGRRRPIRPSRSFPRAGWTSSRSICATRPRWRDFTRYVWAEHEDRRTRLAAGAAAARASGVAVERGYAAEWLEARLAEPQAADVSRVLIHSVVWRCLPVATQDRIGARWPRPAAARPTCARSAGL